MALVRLAKCRRAGLARLTVVVLLLCSARDAAAQQPQQPWLDWWLQPGPGPSQQRPPQRPGPSQIPVQPPTTIPSVLAPTPIEAAPEKGGKLFELNWGTDILEEYSDNFTFASTRPITNFRTMLIPRGTLFIHGAHVEGFLQGRLGTAWDSSTQEPLFLPDTRAGITVAVTPRWTLGASGSFVRTDSPADSNRLDIQPQRSATNSIGLGLTSNYAFTTLALRQSYQFGGFDEGAGNTTTTHTLGAGASLTIAQINTLSADYTYSLSETKTGSSGGGAQGTTGSAQTTSGNQKSTTDGWGIVGSLSREVTPRLVAGISANYSSNTSKQSGGTQGTTGSTGGTQGTTTTEFNQYGATFFSTYTIPSFVLRGSFGIAHLTSGSTVDETVLSSMTGLTYFAGPLTLDASIESGFSNTFAGGGQNNGVVKTQGGAAGASYAFTPKVNARIGASYRVTDQTGVAGGEAGSKNEVFTGTAAVSWQALQWLVLSLDYAYTKSQPADDSTGTSSTTSSGTTGSTGGGVDTGYQENHVRFAIRIDF